jgi:outer membrane immunogenic protein
MKKLSAISCAALLASSAAIAADVPATKPAIPRVAAAPNWTGFYVGAIGGYGWNTLAEKGSTLTISDVDENGNPVSATGRFPGSTAKANGAVFGAQIGADYELANRVVVGIAGDYLRSTKKASTLELLDGRIPIDEKSIWTLRGRAGYAFDNVLIYGTGGLAAAKSAIGLETGDFRDDAHVTHKGWVAGIGAEFRFAGNWRLGAEYRYLSLGTETVDLSASVETTTSAFNVPVTWRAHQALVSLNYQF